MSLPENSSAPGLEFPVIHNCLVGLGTSEFQGSGIWPMIEYWTILALAGLFGRGLSLSHRLQTSAG